MRKLLVLTHIDFWRNGAGAKTRLSSILFYFKDKVKVTIAFAGPISEDDEMTLATNFPEITMRALITNRVEPINEQYRKGLVELVRKELFDVALVEYIELSFAIISLSPNTQTILDIHDIVSDRQKSFRSRGLPYRGIKITWRKEVDVFDQFDYVTVIQENDYWKLRSKLHPDRILLVPHAVQFPKRPVRKSVRHICFIASDYAPNTEAITWFLRNVWASLTRKFDIALNIYGEVGSRISPHLLGKLPSVNIHGFISDINTIYDHCDITINPIRCGAGLKIKNVEAIANGLPLITTGHGALGLEEGINHAFIVAKTQADFRLSLERLICDYSYRRKIASAAYKFALQHFTPETCYGGLAKVIVGAS
jgi:glycosyltransferase involved in cell wall biosynthesis